LNRFLAERPQRRWPALALHGWAGLLLIALAWPLNWGLSGLRTHLLFFPLWLGYALLVDALVLRRRDTSILTRSPKGFALLFACSAPAWWLFEAFNLRTQNWEYLGGDRFGPLVYFLLTSLSFSTVMPIRGTAPEAHAARPARDARRQPGYGRALDDSTGALLPVSVGLGLLSGGTDQRVARSPLACEVPGARGLAARGGASCGRAGVRLLMGDVELLVLSEVDLPYSRRRVPAHLRDAALGLHRLSALRAGALRAGTAHRAAPAEPAPVGLGDGYWMPHPCMLTVVPYPTLPSPPRGPHGPCCSRTAIRPHRVILVPTRASLRPPLKPRPPTCGSREGRGFEPRRSPSHLQVKRGRGERTNAQLPLV
jgi:hypothetical protein